MPKTITSINFEEAKNLIDQTNGLIVILGLAGSGKSKLADICKYDTYLDFENVDKENHLRLNKEIKIPELKNKYGHTLAIKDYMDKCYDYYNIICYGTTVIELPYNVFDKLYEECGPLLTNPLFREKMYYYGYSSSLKEECLPIDIRNAYDQTNTHMDSQIEDDLFILQDIIRHHTNIPVYITKGI